jgi:hypothetical protein
MNPRRFPFAGLALTALLCLGLTAAATGSITQNQNLRVKVTGALAPKKLPRERSAPISVKVGWDISTVDGTDPPRLKRLKIAINRSGHFDFAGLPTCPIDKIQPATSSRALSNCRSALTGKGIFSALVSLEGQESYVNQGRLLVFNGLLHGKPVLLGHIYSAHPFSTSFIIPFTLSEASHGTFGTTLSAKVPSTLSSWGNLIGIEMTLSRRFRYQGHSHSFLTAACPAPKGFSNATFTLARTSFAFTGGRSLTTTLGGTCKVRR